MSYSYFSSCERFTLYQLRTRENLSMGIFAKRMKRSKSSISRELRRNRINETPYLPDTAQHKMEARRQESKQLFMSVRNSTTNEIKQRLALYHSPEQISGRLEYEGLESISHETIYQLVYANHQGQPK
jgi:transposase, IS30 family